MFKIFIFVITILLITTKSNSTNHDFNNWLKDFKKEAISLGVSENVVNELMSNAKFLPKVIEYDRYQPEFYEDTFTYIKKRTSKKKVREGLKLYKKEKEVIDKFIALGDEASRFDQYGSSLSAIKEMFSSDDDRYKVIKNLAYIARADEFIHENEMKMIEQAVSDLDMEDKVSLVKTESTLFVDFKG